MSDESGARARGRLVIGLAVAAGVLVALVGVALVNDRRPAAAEAAPVEEQVELAVTMGELQRHAAKLGYAIAGRNRPLATFYLEETEETLSTVRGVESWEGTPIAHPLGVIMEPLLPPLAAELSAEDWDAAQASYRRLIDGCNRCHAATQHEFLVVTVPQGPAPYNQLFERAP